MEANEHKIDAESRRAALVQMIKLIAEHKVDTLVNSVDLDNGKITVWEKGDGYNCIARLNVDDDDEKFVRDYNKSADALNKLLGLNCVEVFKKITTELSISIPGIKTSILVSDLI